MKKPIRALVNIFLMVLASATNAGSFSLYTESSPAAIGNYAAGIAAEAADASTGWYNPAGLPLLRRQEGVAGLVVISPTAKLRGFSTFSTQNLPSYVQTFDGLSGGKMGYVPSMHYALPLGENFAFGLSLVAPFGLATEWDRVSAVRYAATNSYLITSNLSPEIGGRLSEHLSIGLGIDLQYARVRFNRVIGSPALLQNFRAPMLLDSLSYNKGHSFGIGFHAGVMGLFNQEHSRIGLNYQSQLRHRFNGYSRLQGRLASLGPVVSPAAVARADGEAIFWSTSLTSNNIILPAVTTLSGYQDIDERLALLASVVYTGWNSLKVLELNRVAAYAPQMGQVIINSETVENYRNAWRFAFGANYHVTEKWMMRAGGGYDQTPTRNYYRDVRIPDANRWAFSIGTHYQFKANLGIDFGYTRLFSAGDAHINRTDIAGTDSLYNVNARVKANADLYGLQAVWAFDQPPPAVTK